MNKSEKMKKDHVSEHVYYNGMDSDSIEAHLERTPLTKDANKKNIQETEDWKSFKIRRSIIYYLLLLFCCFGLFASNTIQGIFFKRMSDDVPTGFYFLLTFCSAIFVVIFTIATIARNLFNYVMKRALGKETGPKDYVSHKELMLLGFLDSINGLILLSAAHQTAAAFHAILPQSMIPLTFVFSFVIIRNKFILKFFIMDFVSALVVALGVLVSLIPVIIELFKNPSSWGTSVVWPLVFLAGFIPGSLMNVFQERFTRDKANLDYLHLLNWVSIYQVITDICFFWVVFVIPGSNINNLRDFGGMLDSGFSCLAGKDIIIDGAVKGNCKMAALDLSVFVLGYVGTYIFTAIILRMASSIFLILANAPVNPITAVIFFIVGMDSMNWYNGASIPIMIVGVAIHISSDFYKTKTEKNSHKSGYGEESGNGRETYGQV